MTPAQVSALKKRARHPAIARWISSMHLMASKHLGAS